MSQEVSKLCQQCLINLLEFDFCPILKCFVIYVFELFIGALLHHPIIEVIEDITVQVFSSLSIVDLSLIPQEGELINRNAVGEVGPIQCSVSVILYFVFWS